MKDLKIDKLNHVYYLDNKKLFSVTDALSIYGAFDMVDLDVLKKAQKKGTEVHRTTECYDHGIIEMSIVGPEINPYLQGWKNFLIDSGFEITFIEKSGYHKIHKYAYTIDRGGIYKNKKTILDIKSGSVDSKTTKLQTAGYLDGINSWIDKRSDKFTDRITVRLRPEFKRGYKIIRHEDKTDINIFICVVNAYKWGRRNGYLDSTR